LGFFYKNALYKFTVIIISIIDGLVNAMPNMQKTLLQFTTLVYIKSSAICKEYLTGTGN